MRKYPGIQLLVATAILAGWWLYQRDSIHSGACSQTVAPTRTAPQIRASRDRSIDEIPSDAAPQNAPCVGQPRSGRELMASFQRALAPSASELDGTWVEIGAVQDGPSSQFRSLNCSGVKQHGNFDFVMVASGYSVDLYAVGDDPQKVTMKPDRKDKGSLKFALDEGADEGPVIFRCRLTDRGTLICLNSQDRKSVV